MQPQQLQEKQPEPSLSETASSEQAAVQVSPIPGQTQQNVAVEAREEVLGRGDERLQRNEQPLEPHELQHDTALPPQNDDNAVQLEQQQTIQQQTVQQLPEEDVMELEARTDLLETISLMEVVQPQGEPYDSPTLELSSSSPCLSPSPPRSPMSPMIASLPPADAGEGTAWPHISILPAAVAFQLSSGAPSVDDMAPAIDSALESPESAAVTAVEDALLDVSAELEKIVVESAQHNLPDLAVEESTLLLTEALSTTATAPTAGVLDEQQPPAPSPLPAPSSHHVLEEELQQPKVGTQPQQLAPTEAQEQSDERRSEEEVQASKEHVTTPIEDTRESEVKENLTMDGAAGEELQQAVLTEAAESVEIMTLESVEARTLAHTEPEAKPEVEADGALTEGKEEAREEDKGGEEEKAEEGEADDPFQYLDLLKRDEIVVQLQNLGLPVRSTTHRRLLFLAVVYSG
jgi:hypothetical protein